MRPFRSARQAALVLWLVVASGCRWMRPDPYRVVHELGPWIAALGSDDLVVSDPAEDSLVSLGPPAVAPLATALEREAPPVRRGVVTALARLNLPEVVPPLIRAANEDPDEDVRAEALRALGTLGDARARPVVEAALDAPAVKLRHAAARACATLCASPEAANRLVEIAVRDQPLAVGLNARASLVRMLEGPDPSRSASARRALEDRARPALTEGSAFEERARAALLVAELDDPTTTPVLVEVARGPNPLRIYAVYALGRVGDGRAVPVLAIHLQAADPGLAAYSYDALRRLQDRGLDEARAALDGYRGPAPAGPLRAPGL